MSVIACEEREMHLTVDHHHLGDAALRLCLIALKNTAFEMFPFKFESIQHVSALLHLAVPNCMTYLQNLLFVNNNKVIFSCTGTRAGALKGPSSFQ